MAQGAAVVLGDADAAQGVPAATLLGLVRGSLAEAGVSSCSLKAQIDAASDCYEGIGQQGWNLMEL